jgi:hypothetical protein
MTSRRAGQPRGTMACPRLSGVLDSVQDQTQ